MRRTILLALPLLLLAACGSGNKHTNNGATISNGTPPVEQGAAATPTTHAALASPSAVPSATPVQPTGAASATTGAGAASVVPTAASAATATTTAALTAQASATAAAGSVVPPPPPPPPAPPSTSRGRGDTSGATLPVGDLCPLGFPIKGDSNAKFHQPTDADYATVKPVACFATVDDATVAGYTPIGPVG